MYKKGNSYYIGNYFIYVYCKTIGVCVYCIKNSIDIDIDCNYCTIIITKNYPISGGNQNVTILENWKHYIQVHTINNCTLTYSSLHTSPKKQHQINKLIII